MNSELLKKAHEKIRSTPVLVNLISKRERELINGAKPLVRPNSLDEDKCDIALREVAEGKLIAEIDFDAYAKAGEAFGNGKPTVILFKSDMGHGVDFMAGTHKWHGKAPSTEQCETALAQLEETLGDF